MQWYSRQVSPRFQLHTLSHHRYWGSRCQTDIHPSSPNFLTKRNPLQKPRKKDTAQNSLWISPKWVSHRMIHTNFYSLTTQRATHAQKYQILSHHNCPVFLFLDKDADVDKHLRIILASYKFKSYNAIEPTTPTIRSKNPTQCGQTKVKTSHLYQRSWCLTTGTDLFGCLSFFPFTFYIETETEAEGQSSTVWCNDASTVQSHNNITTAT